MPEPLPQDPPRARVVHRSPGRLRLRVQGHRHDRALFEHLAERFRRMPGVTGTECDPGTGSILVHHHARAEDLLDRAKSGAVLALRTEGETMRSLERSLDLTVAAIDQNTQNRDTQAIQIKLDELIRTTRSARNSLISLEDCSEDKIAGLKADFAAIAERAEGDKR